MSRIMKELDLDSLIVQKHSNVLITLTFLFTRTKRRYAYFLKNFEKKYYFAVPENWV